MERISFDCRWKPGKPGFHQAAIPRSVRQIVSRAVDGGNFDLKKEMRDLVTVFRKPSIWLSVRRTSQPVGV